MACGAGCAQRVPTAPRPPVADRLPCEPRRRGREHRTPGGDRNGGEPRLEHSGHRDAHQDVQPVGVAFGVPAAQAGDGEAVRAVDGDRDHEHREAAREPGRSAHAGVFLAACDMGCLPARDWLRRADGRPRARPGELGAAHDGKRLFRRLRLPQDEPIENGCPARLPRSFGKPGAILTYPVRVFMVPGSGYSVRAAVTRPGYCDSRPVGGP